MGIRPTALYSDLLLDLSEAVRDPEILSLRDPPPDVTPREFACHVLSKTFYKKFVDSVEPDADERAFTKFLAVNERCGSWALPRLSERDAILLGEFKQSIYQFWFSRSGYAMVNSLHDLLDHAATGPGAAVGALGGDFYTKLFSSPLTTTFPVLYETYEDYISQHPVWHNAESLRYAEFGGPDIVAGNRFHFVPKQNDISRLICVEPSLNVFYQLGLGTLLSNRLRSFFKIDLNCQQEVNRELARRGSLDESFATIDLSSASDSMSLRMLREVLPTDFYRWLVLLRSPKGELRRSVGSFEASTVALHMVSTMGNGFTFPLQTMLFACIVNAAHRFRSNPSDPDRLVSPHFSVFGDDIVCPKFLVKDVLRLIEILGFEVNPLKTFTEGLFRESCGYDFIKGYNVRGFYVKKLETQQDRYAVINGLNLWCSKTGVILRRTLQRLLSSVKYQPVPPSENDDAGIKVPSFLLPGFEKRSKNTGTIMYRRSISRASKIRVTESRLIVPPGAKNRIFNPGGLMMAFLHGSVKSGVINIRHGVNHYSTK